MVFFRDQFSIPSHHRIGREQFCASLQYLSTETLGLSCHSHSLTIGHDILDFYARELGAIGEGGEPTCQLYPMDRRTSACNPFSRSIKSTVKSQPILNRPPILPDSGNCLDRLGELESTRNMDAEVRRRFFPVCPTDVGLMCGPVLC